METMTDTRSQEPRRPSSACSVELGRFGADDMGTRPSPETVYRLLDALLAGEAFAYSMERTGDKPSKAAANHFIQHWGCLHVGAIEGFETLLFAEMQTRGFSPAVICSTLGTVYESAGRWGRPLVCNARQMAETLEAA